MLSDWEWQNLRTRVNDLERELRSMRDEAMQRRDRISNHVLYGSFCFSMLLLVISAIIVWGK